MVIEEGPAQGGAPLDFVQEWRGVYPTREALEQKIGDRLAWSVAPSFRETAQGWTLAFDPEDLASIQRSLAEDSWTDWLGSSCPALVIRGTQSKAVDGTVLESMADRRPGTRLVSLEAGHVTHHDDPAGFHRAVRDFLDHLPEIDPR